MVHRSPDRYVPLHRPAPPPREVKRTNYVGIDVGKKRCAAYVTDEKGGILRELTYRNTRIGIESLAMTLTSYRECTAVLESTGNLWLKTYETLEGQRYTGEAGQPPQDPGHRGGPHQDG